MPEAENIPTNNNSTKVKPSVDSKEQKSVEKDSDATVDKSKNTKTSVDKKTETDSTAKTVEKQSFSSSVVKSTSKPAAATTPAATAVAKPTVQKNTTDEPPEEKAAKASKALQKAEDAIRAAEKAEADARLAAEKAAAARAEAEAAAEAEYKAIAAQIKSDVAKKNVYTYKRQSEEIFRRDMGEPEFFLDKNDRFQRPILTPQQQESLTRHAETPQDQTPQYVPEHVLSPEFEGVTNYERGVSSYLKDLREKLRMLQKDPNKVHASDISNLKSKITYLESLHENYHIGMNVFRTARGGRSKINAK